MSRHTEGETGNLEGGAEEELEEPILISLRQITRAIDLYSRRLAREYTLTAPQLICLRELHRSEGMTLGELASAVSLSSATVSGILRRLEDRGLLERRRGRQDRRVVRSFLTAEGLRLVQAAPRPLQETFSARLSEVTAERRREILEALESIVDMMGAREIGAPPLLDSFEVGGGPDDETP